MEQLLPSWLPKKEPELEKYVEFLEKEKRSVQEIDFEKKNFVNWFDSCVKAYQESDFELLATFMERIQASIDNALISKDDVYVERQKHFYKVAKHFFDDGIPF